MAGINFKGVEEAKDKVLTRPGTIAVFKMTDVKFDTSKNKGTYYMGITFTRPEDEFTHSFYLSEKALPRVKTLVKTAAEVELDTEILEEKLIALLKNKDIACKVTARFDESNGRAYPDLSFGGFCKRPANIAELAFNTKEIELNAKAVASYEAAAHAKPEAAHAAISSDFAGSVPAIADEEIF